MKGGLDIWEFLLAPLYLVITYLIAKSLESRLTTFENRKYYYWGFWAKQIGAFFFVMIYIYYYGGGDTTHYHHDAKIISQAFWSNPIVGIKVLLTEARELSNDTFEYTKRMWMFKGNNSWTVSRCAGFAEIFTFGTFLPASLLFGLWSFLGVWQIYRLFYYFYPHLYKQLALACLFIPSTIFWSSGILKETLTSGGIGLFLYACFSALYLKRNIIISSIIAISTFLLIKEVKGITIMAFIPCFAGWLALRYQFKIIENIILRRLFILTILISFLGAFFLLRNEVTKEIEQQTFFQEAQHTIAGFQWDHGQRITKGHGGGSASQYHLECAGDLSFTGMLNCMPEAIFTAFFRPLPWDTFKIVTFLMSFEGLFLLLAFIWCTYKIIPNLLDKLSNPEIILSLSYCILFGFIVGYTSFNFGVLTRFKTPMMPFMTASLVLLFYNSKSVEDFKK